MAECKECSKPIKAWEALGGACEDCYPRVKEKEDSAERELAQCLLPRPTHFKALKLPNILV